jgi:hypothetical protein
MGLRTSPKIGNWLQSNEEAMLPIDHELQPGAMDCS